MIGYPPHLHPEITDEQLQQSMADAAACCEGHRHIRIGYGMLADADDPQQRALHRFFSQKHDDSADTLATRLVAFRQMADDRRAWRDQHDVTPESAPDVAAVET